MAVRSTQGKNRPVRSTQGGGGVTLLHVKRQLYVAVVRRYFCVVLFLVQTLARLRSTEQLYIEDVKIIDRYIKFIIRLKASVI